MKHLTFLATIGLVTVSLLIFQPLSAKIHRADRSKKSNTSRVVRKDNTAQTTYQHKVTQTMEPTRVENKVHEVSAPRPAAAPVTVQKIAVSRVRVAPPAARIEVIPARPAMHSVWIPGYWIYNPVIMEYVWNGGYWDYNPYGTRWIPGYWQLTDGFYVRISGRWIL